MSSLPVPSVAMALWLGSGCGGDASQTPPSSSTTPTASTADTSTSTTPSTSTPTADSASTLVEEWPYPNLPELDSDELVRGREARIRVEGAPAGARVVFYDDDSEMGEGPCEEDGLCFGLLDPQLLGEATADDEGVAVFTQQVPADEPPKHVFFQAVVEDPAGPARFATDPVLRYVAMGQSESPATFTKVQSREQPHPYTDGNSHTGGIAWVDYNGDFWPDLFITNGGGLRQFLFRNDGDGTFSDVSDLVRKPHELVEPAGVKFGDFDNDGDSDIFLPVDTPHPFNSQIQMPHDGGPNLLYLNNGDGTFDEAAEAAGLLDPRGWRNSAAALGDIDNDGFLDVYLGNWAPGNWPHDNDDRMLRNQGDGTFADVTEEQGTDSLARDTLTAQFFDADLDGKLDLYVGNIAHIDSPPDYQPDDIFYLNGAGSFRDATADSPGLGDDAIAAMGIDVGDIDNDGDFDVYVTDKWDATEVLPLGNPLYLGNGDGTFSDNACQDRGVCVGWVSWPAKFEDFDRDGDLDLWTATQNTWMPDQLFVNDGTGHFTYHLLDDFVDNAAHGGSTADFDGDGDVDIYVWNQASDSTLLVNDGIDDNHWLELKLFGTASNRDAIGAIVRATTSSGTQMRRVSGGDSAHSQRELILHFGLGTDDSAEIEVTWPSGTVQDLGTVSGDSLVFVDESEGVLDERLTFVEAQYFATTQELLVRAKSSFGGRTTLEATGLGPLAYDAAEVGHGFWFPKVAIPPLEVEITADRGGSWTVPVEVVP